MLDKIIQKLKDLIPKKKGAVENKIETAAPASPGPAAPASSEEEAKKKKKALIIKIVAGVAVLYVALDEFVLKKEPPSEPVKTEVSQKKKSERKPKKSLKDNQKEEAISRDVSSAPGGGEAKPSTSAPENAVTPEPLPSPTTGPTATSDQPASPATPEVTTASEQPAAPEAPTATEQPAAVEATPPGTEAPGTSEQAVATEATIPAPTETTTEGPKATEETASVETNSIPPSTEETSGKELVGSPTEELAKDMGAVSGEVAPITEGETKPAEKVQLPDYTIKGRGLVYNCTGKHWACIDRAGYLSCKEHQRWSQENSKSPECVIKNVYSSEEDCGVIQLHYINTNESTDFCK